MAAPKGNKFAEGCTTSGAPTKYQERFVQDLIEFFDQEPYEDIPIDHYGKEGEVKWTDIKRMPRKLPTMIEFHRHLKSLGFEIGIRTMYDWIDENHGSYQKEFSQTYTRIAKDFQKEFIIQNGLQGINNPLFAKFVAVNMTDMRDKVNNEHSGENGGPIAVIIRGDDAKL